MNKNPKTSSNKPAFAKPIFTKHKLVKKTSQPPIVKPKYIKSKPSKPIKQNFIEKQKEISENYERKINPKIGQQEIQPPEKIIVKDEGAVMNYNWYASFSLGASFVEAGKTQSVQLDSDPEAGNSKYSPNLTSQFVTEFGLSIGKHFILQYPFSLDVGIGIYRTVNIEDNGTKHQFEDEPELGQLRYSYTIRSTRIMAEAKLYTTLQRFLLPYLSIGIGASINQTNNYGETTTEEGIVPIQPFSGNKIIQCAYQIGLGIDIPINKDFSAGIGWQYVSFGRAELGLSPSQNSDGRLSSGNIGAHGMNVHLTYHH